MRRFKNDRCNFVVLLDHYPAMKGAAGDLQKWIEDKTSRSDFRPPTDSVPLSGQNNDI